MDTMEVLEPQWLRADIAEKLRNLTKTYKIQSIKEYQIQSSETRRKRRQIHFSYLPPFLYG